MKHWCLTGSSLSGVGALLGFPSVLLLDTFRCHLANSMKKLLPESRTELIVILGGMTSQLQPLNICIKNPFRDWIKHCYQEWRKLGDLEVMTTGRLKRASPAVLCSWIVDAWASIPEELVIRSFKKCGISNALDGSEGDFLWEDIFDKATSGDSASETDD